MKAKMDVNAKSITVEIPWILATQLEHVLYAGNIPAGVSYSVGGATRKYSFDRRRHNVETIQAALKRANIPTMSAEDRAEQERARKIPIAATTLTRGMTGSAMRGNDFKTLGDLADKTEAELVKMHGVAGKTLNHIKAVLEEHHLSLKD